MGNNYQVVQEISIKSTEEPRPLRPSLSPPKGFRILQKRILPSACTRLASPFRVSATHLAYHRRGCGILYFARAAASSPFLLRLHITTRSDQVHQTPPPTQPNKSPRAPSYPYTTPPFAQESNPLSERRRSPIQHSSSSVTTHTANHHVYRRGESF
jgi:hypothetical protein